MDLDQSLAPLIAFIHVRLPLYLLLTVELTTTARDIIGQPKTKRAAYDLLCAFQRWSSQRQAADSC